MKVFDSIEASASIEAGCVLTIGNFDGLHPGHLDIIAAAKDAAARISAPVAIMTFDPHPLAILHPENVPNLLTPLPLKKQLLANAGIDYLIVVKDSCQLLNLSPQDFVDQLLIETIKPGLIVEGPNFHFGYGRSGSLETLKDLSKSRSFHVLEIPFHKVRLSEENNLVPCSSTLVRSLLEKGSVADAAVALGRNYRLIGRVIKGRGVGRKIGYPTANMEPLKQVIPAEAVYAGFVHAADSIEDLCEPAPQKPAAFSIGRSKTFTESKRLLIEAHILEENVEDLVGKYLAMDFVQRLRGQQRFDSPQILADQIEKDCQKALKILNPDFPGNK